MATITMKKNNQVINVDKKRQAHYEKVGYEVVTPTPQAGGSKKSASEPSPLS